MLKTERVAYLFKEARATSSDSLNRLDDATKHWDRRELLRSAERAWDAATKATNALIMAHIGIEPEPHGENDTYGLLSKLAVESPGCKELKGQYTDFSVFLYDLVICNGKSGPAGNHHPRHPADRRLHPPSASGWPGLGTAMANALFYGDNLAVLRERVADESVDLVYLDPPFNSNASYNVLFREKTGEESPAQIRAFTDTWEWTQETEFAFEHDIIGSPAVPSAVKDMISAFRQFIGAQRHDGLLGDDGAPAGGAAPRPSSPRAASTCTATPRPATTSRF